MKNEDIHYEALSSVMVQTIPAVKAAYEKELAWWKEGKPGQHIIFNDILFPYVASLLKEGGQDQELRRIFEFLERLANHPDEHVPEVVHNSICEPLCCDEAALQKARKFMGPTMVKFCQMILTWEPPKK